MRCSYCHYIIPSHSRRREEARGLPPLLHLVSLRFTRFVFAFERSITLVHSRPPVFKRRSNLLSSVYFSRSRYFDFSWLQRVGENIRDRKRERERQRKRYRFIHSAMLLKYQACRRIIRRASPRLLWGPFSRYATGWIRVQKPQGYEGGRSGERERGGRRRRGNENTRRVPSLRGSMLVVVSDRRTVNEARVGFLSRQEDNVLRGGRERGREREKESSSFFTLSSRLHRPLPVFCIRYRICPRPGHRPESVYIYIYIYIPWGEGWALLLGWCPEKKKKKKERILLENNYSTFGLWRPRRGLSPLNIEILGPFPPCFSLDTFIWMDLSSPLQVSMIFRDWELYIESHRGVETPLLFGDPVGASGTDLCILSYCDPSKSIYFIFEGVTKRVSKKIFISNFLDR